MRVEGVSGFADGVALTDDLGFFFSIGWATGIGSCMEGEDVTCALVLAFGFDFLFAPPKKYAMAFSFSLSLTSLGTAFVKEAFPLFHSLGCLLDIRLLGFFIFVG